VNAGKHRDFARRSRERSDMRDCQRPHPDSLRSSGYLPALKLFGIVVAILAIIAAAEHDKAVAEVIGYVMRLNGALRG